jgi:2-amino-4-hydroxy-6-hydroxymethyldihydropteridine diphosphokinase
MSVEDSLGRTRGIRRGPRTIDIDILLFGDRVIMLDNLEVPHPRMLVRPFVLEPLSQLCPLHIVPRTGRTVSELAEHIRNKSGISGRIIRVVGR